MRLRFLSFLCLALLPAVAMSETISAPGPEITAGANDAAWQTLFRALAEKGAVFSHVTERHWLKFRKQPVELSVEMRLSPEHGLSLHYEDRTVIVDEKGVLLRDARGRSRAAPHDDRAPAVNVWLLPVLRFDLPALEKSFRLFGAREGEAWRIDFVPRETVAGKQNSGGGVGPIVVHGEGDSISRIELQPKPDLRIEIVIRDAQPHAEFSSEELKKYFR